VSKPLSYTYSKEAVSFHASPFTMFKLGRSDNSNRVEFSVTIQVEFVNDRTVHGVVTAVSAQDIAPGVWTHIAGTYDQKKGVVTIFVNGVEDGSAKAAMPGKITSGAGLPLYVGRTSRAVPDEAFHGRIDELRIWNTTRTLNQIRREYDVYMYGDEPGLLFYMNLEQGNEVEATGNVDMFCEEAQYNGVRVVRTANSPVRRAWEKPRVVRDTTEL
jgi:hypothetical protein